MHGIERLVRAAVLVACAFVLLVHAAGAQSVTPSGLLDSYERAWGQHDVDAALAVLADDAVITFQAPRSRSMTNPREIREFLESGGIRAEPVLTMGRQVDGNAVNWSERIDDQYMGSAELSVQAIVEDGKIQSLVYRSARQVRRPGVPAASVTPQSAGAVLVAVVLLSLGLFSLASGDARGRSSSNLHGRLIGELRRWRASPRASV